MIQLNGISVVIGRYKSQIEGMFHSKAGLSLRTKSILNMFSNLFSQVASVANTLLFTPVIVAGLGKELYGAWNVIGKLTGFAGNATINPSLALKYQLQLLQNNDDNVLKKRLVGAAVAQVILLLPIVLIVGALLGIYLPKLVTIKPVYISSVLWAFGIMWILSIITQLLSIPSVVLKSMNCAYEAMGSNAVAIFMGGLLCAIGVYYGYGIIVLAISSVIGIVIVNGLRQLVAVSKVHWYGIMKPRAHDVVISLKLGMWSSAVSLVSNAYLALDVFVINKIVGTASVTDYVIASTMLRALSIPCEQVLSSCSPSFAFLAGNREWNRLATRRIDVWKYVFSLIVGISCTMIVVNSSFIRIWMNGKQFVIGPYLVVLMCVYFILRLAAWNELDLLDYRLCLKERFMILTVGLVVGSILSVYGGKMWGAQGVVAGLVFSSCIILCMSIVTNYYKIPDYSKSIREFTRSLFISLIMLLTTLVINEQISVKISGWFTLVLTSIAIFTTSFGLYFALLNGKHALGPLWSVIFTRNES